MITKSGVGFNNPVQATGEPRSEPEENGHTGGRFQRRLERIAQRVKVRKLSDDVYVCDFALFRDELTDQLRRAVKQSTRYDYDSREDIQRWGSTNVSAVILSVHGDGFRVEEFVIRLPSADLPRDETPHAVVDLIEEISPPASSVNVWIRPPASAIPGSFRGRGQIEGHDDPYPHVGVQDAAIHPTVFLDFLSDLCNTYSHQKNS